jgi:hypothetical protein
MAKQTELSWERQEGRGEDGASRVVRDAAEAKTQEILSGMGEDWLVIFGRNAGVWGNYRSPDTGNALKDDGWSISGELGIALKYPGEEFWAGEESNCSYEGHAAYHFASAHETGDGVRFDLDSGFRRYHDAVEVFPGKVVSNGEVIARVTGKGDDLQISVSRLHLEQYLAARGEMLVVLHSVTVDGDGERPVGPMATSGENYFISVFNNGTHLTSVRGKTIVRGSVPVGLTADMMGG